MWNYDNYYRLLRVDSNVDAQGLTNAYRREMDAVAKLRFKWLASIRRWAIQSAFDTLSDRDRRRVYDQHLEMFGGHVPQPPM